MPLWTPKNITTALWLDASDSSTLFDATSGGSTPANGGAVARWEDKSGNARHATQSTLSNRPTWQTSSLNSLAVTRFAAASAQRLTCTGTAGSFNFLHNSQGLVLAVATIGTTADPNALYGIAGNSGGFSASRRGFNLLWDDRASIPSSNGFLVNGYDGNNANVFSHNVSDVILPQVATLLGASVDATNATLNQRVTLLINGQAYQGNTANATASAGDANFDWQVGDYNTGSFYLQGDVAELLVLPAASVSVANRQSCEGYLAWKWGLQSSLSSDHPYKWFAPGSRFRSSFSSRYTYQPPKAKTYSVIRVKETDHANLREGLVGAWCPSIAGSGNLLPDVSGRGNHGTLTNMAADDWVSGQYGRALDFDGSNDYATTDLTNTGGAYFSAFCWWRRTAAASSVQAIGQYTTGTNNRSWTMITGQTTWTGPPTGNEFAVIVSADGTVNNPVHKAAWVNRNLSDGQWYHVGFTFRPNVIEMFINGVSQAITYQNNGTVNSIYKTTGSNVSIGALNVNTTPTSFFNGQLDDLRVYDRALSYAEIRLLASKRGIGLEPRKPKLLFHQFPSGAKRRLLLTGQT